MPELTIIKKGLTINLAGKAEKILVNADYPRFVSIQPTDFHLLTPKLLINVGDSVKVGTALFYDKAHPEIKFTSPVCGKIIAINRGERRLVQEVVIETSGNREYENFIKADPESLSREIIIEELLKSGLWPTIIQRPFSIIANPADMPKAIFISTFDSSPLAPDYEWMLKDSINDFQTGINALKKLTKGKLHLGVNAFQTNSIFNSIKGAEINAFKGIHPTGNVGIQIHHINPINKGDIVWVVSPQDVVTIGRLFVTGQYDPTKIVVVSGSEVKTPKYYRTLRGTSIDVLIKNNIGENNPRYISGNPLTGSQIMADGSLGFYDNQLTVLPEGKYYEFLGWALPGFKKFSFSRLFFSWLTPSKNYTLDTNLHGGLRSFVLTGQYEKVFPMDILPVQLVKSIIAKDIDKMELLGIYEVAPEDFALCEFVCTSKINVQEIIRNGLDLMIREMN